MLQQAATSESMGNGLRPLTNDFHKCTLYQAVANTSWESFNIVGRGIKRQKLVRKKKQRSWITHVSEMAPLTFSWARSVNFTWRGAGTVPFSVGTLAGMSHTLIVQSSLPLTKNELDNLYRMNNSNPFYGEISILLHYFYTSCITQIATNPHSLI